ncbi:hypothetical protein [Streptomyces sp. NPDC001205]
MFDWFRLDRTEEQDMPCTSRGEGHTLRPWLTTRLGDVDLCWVGCSEVRACRGPAFQAPAPQSTGTIAPVTMEAWSLSSHAATSAYLEMCERQNADPLAAGRARIAVYVRELTSLPRRRARRREPWRVAPPA